MIMSNNGGANNGVMLKKGPWSVAEDGVLMDYVRKHGEGNWNAVQRNTGLLRCGKSCRLRWANHLRPNLKKGAFSNDEERLIIHLHSKLGNKWARISAHLPGRTDNEIKNYWNTRVKRRIRQGLPLYPNNLPLPTPPPPPPPPTPLHPPPPPLTLLNPVSLPSSLFSPPFFPPQNSFMGAPTFSLSQLGSSHINSIGFGTHPAHKMGFQGFGFRCPSFELPSNQHTKNVAYSFGDENKANNVINPGRANSGLLDDLLHEAQVMVGLKREREEDCSLPWDVSSSENSCTGIKDEPEEQELKLESEEIPDILELIPSLVEVPTWCTDGGTESSAAPSSAVNTTDYDADGDWNPGCYSWNNLPRFC